MPDQAVTLATVLKSLGYETGQFGKNHLGDLNKFLPTVHGFDEFFGYLYHLDAMSDPYWFDYPQDWIDKIRPARPDPCLRDRRGRSHGDAALGQGRQAADRRRRAAGAVPEHGRACRTGRKAARPSTTWRRSTTCWCKASNRLHGQGEEGRQAVLRLAQHHAHARVHLHPAEVSGDDELSEQLRPRRSRHGADGRQHRRRC